MLPIMVGCFALTLISERSIALTGGLASMGLAGIALAIPIDQALRLGPISLKIASSASFLGRSLVLPAAEAPLLALIFGLCALWFFGAEATGSASRLIPFGLIIAALLVASIAVQPFLFASILIEMAVLIAVPLISPPDQTPGRGVIRFVTYQTLGMPFILFAGWLLAGVETSPGDLSLTIQSKVMLGLGFAFLLAIFPLFDWIPQLMEENNPYAIGFLLWLLPSIVAVFGMNFLDRYAWLRTSPDVIAGLRGLGLVMLVSGGLWSAFQDHLGRIMAYATIAETGFLLLATSLAADSTTNLVFVLLIPRGLGLATWALALSVFKSGGAGLHFSAIQGLARAYPWASAGVVLAALSTAGFPLLAGFPPHVALWQGLDHVSSAFALWFLLGVLGLMIGAMRQLAVLIMGKGPNLWTPKESLVQRGMLGLGMLGIFVLGIFPQALGFITGNLPLMYQHLSR
jgi:formate hydrogenlyase subunit 3/multisubunit Na+/H+ antiporter MnhD subunit